MRFREKVSVEKPKKKSFIEFLVCDNFFQLQQTLIGQTP